MKKIILAIIITAVVCISGTVFAVTQINASEVTYTKNGTDTTVDVALNDLYTTANQLINNRELTSDKSQTNLGLGPTTSGSFSVTSNSYYIITIFHKSDVPVTLSGARVIGSIAGNNHVFGISTNSEYVNFKYETFYVYTTSDTITVTSNADTRMSYSKMRLFQ